MQIPYISIIEMLLTYSIINKCTEIAKLWANFLSIQLSTYVQSKRNNIILVTHPHMMARKLNYSYMPNNISIITKFWLEESEITNIEWCWQSWLILTMIHQESCVSNRPNCRQQNIKLFIRDSFSLMTPWCLVGDYRHFWSTC
jgi:hypothetical protein